jgi:uroporphyrinogen decarboxylase
MNHRERVLTALHHEEPDRVPLDLGGRQTTFMIETYNKFKAHLGLDHIPTEIMSHKWQTACVDEQILDRYSVDCRHVRPSMKDDIKFEEAGDGKTAFVDEWGVRRIIDSGYASIIKYPLQTAATEDLAGYEWPHPAELFDFSGLRSQARRLAEEGKFAIVGNMGSPGNIFEQSWYLRGLTEFFMDLVDNKDFAHALLSKITEIRKQNAEYFLREVGEYLDVFQLADDLAMQNGPYMSPELYREMIKPYQVELFGFVKALTPAKIYYHSCGSVTRLLDDLVEVGVDILNPVQISADGMEPDRLKQRFGNRLSFWGSIDTTEILPNGSVDDVYNEVSRIIHHLAPGGGFVLAAVHNLQPDIPPENIHAMFEAALQYGTYPIS